MRGPDQSKGFETCILPQNYCNFGLTDQIQKVLARLTLKLAL